MSLTPEECLAIYGRAWLERDDERRLALLGECMADDIRFADPQLGCLEGRRAVSESIGEFQRARRAELASDGGGGQVSVRAVTPIDVLHGFFRFSFIWSLPDGSQWGGTDFGEFDEEGRLRLVAVFEGSPDFPVPGLEWHRDR